MQATITIDDELYQTALEMAGSAIEPADLFREALQTFVRVQASKRLAALGGLAPEMQSISRNRDIEAP